MAVSKRKCKQCKTFYPAESGLILPVGFFCTKEHAFQFANEKKEQGRKKLIRHKNQVKNKQAKEERQKIKSDLLKVKRKNLKWQHKLTQKAFNKMRVLEEIFWFRQRGLEPECISCGRPLGGDQWCCGHFKTLGAQSGLRYDPKNAYLQHNHRCNMNLSGDIEGTKTTRGYKQGLKVRFGEKDGQSIIDYCESNTSPIKWNWEELEKMRLKFNSRARNLKLLLSTLDQ